MKKNPVVHFEMPATDAERVRKFYSTVFGWDMPQMGPEMDNYVLAGTTDTGEDMMPKTPGAINGGFWLVDKDEKLPPPHVVISVDHLDESIELVKVNGGEIVDGPMDIPGIGTYASFRDTEGNLVGMLQPS